MTTNLKSIKIGARNASVVMVNGIEIGIIFYGKKTSTKETPFQAYAMMNKETKDNALLGSFYGNNAKEQAIAAVVNNA